MNCNFQGKLDEKNVKFWLTSRKQMLTFLCKSLGSRNLSMFSDLNSSFPYSKMASRFSPDQRLIDFMTDKD